MQYIFAAIYETLSTFWMRWKLYADCHGVARKSRSALNASNPLIHGEGGGAVRLLPGCGVLPFTQKIGRQQYQKILDFPKALLWAHPWEKRTNKFSFTTTQSTCTRGLEFNLLYFIYHTLVYLHSFYWFDIIQNERLLGFKQRRCKNLFNFAWSSENN